MTTPNARRRRGDPPDPPPDPRHDRPQRMSYFDERRLSAERADAKRLAEQLLRDKLQRKERTFVMSFRMDEELDAVVDRLVPEVAKLLAEGVGLVPPPGRSDVMRLGIVLLRRALLGDKA